MTVNNSGSTLGGSGTISGPVTVNANAKITGATAGSIGALTLQNSVTFTGTNSINLATYFVDLAAGANNSDRLTIGGALNLSNIFDQIQFNGTADGTSSYVLATYSSITGTFDFTNTPAGYQLIYGTNTLTLAPVPEPSTWAVGLLSVVVLAYSQRSKFSHGRRRLRGPVGQGA